MLLLEVYKRICEEEQISCIYSHNKSWSGSKVYIIQISVRYPFDHTMILGHDVPPHSQCPPPTYLHHHPMSIPPKSLPIPCSPRLIFNHLSPLYLYHTILNSDVKNGWHIHTKTRIHASLLFNIIFVCPPPLCVQPPVCLYPPVCPSPPIYSSYITVIFDFHPKNTHRNNCAGWGRTNPLNPLSFLG